jgi:hypothetical protein
VAQLFNSPDWLRRGRPQLPRLGGSDTARSKPGWLERLAERVQAGERMPGHVSAKINQPHRTRR